METGTCTMCNIEKNINKLYKKHSECIDCNRTKGLKRYYEKKIRYQINKKLIMKNKEIE